MEKPSLQSSGVSYTLVKTRAVAVSSVGTRVNWHYIDRREEKVKQILNRRLKWLKNG